MSIIYDALQKIQQSREKKRDGSPFLNQLTQISWIDMGLSICIGALMLALAFVTFPSLKMYAESLLGKSATVVIPSGPPIFNATEYKNKNSLNGIFVSPTEKTALINNQFFKIGDHVDGMKIVSIENDGVTLRNNEATLVLRVAS